MLKSKNTVEAPHLRTDYYIDEVRQKSRTKANSVVCDKLFLDLRRKNYREFFLIDFISRHVKADRNR